MNRVAILQSNYIPWKGYFDLIGAVDVFVLYDDMQYTKNDWRNRNKIKTAQGVQWLTIPIRVRGKFTQKINETRIFEKRWAEKHLKSLEFNYKRSLYFDDIFPWLEKLYLEAGKLELLSQINFLFIKEICKRIGICTKLIDSRQFKIEGTKSHALISVLKQIKEIDSYLSGPSAKDYLDEDIFTKENIKVNWMDYNGYPEYRQLHLPFVHEVSILDLFFNEGRNAPAFLKSMKSKL